MMNIREHLLVCLSEECVEVSKEVSKALRFGLEDLNPNTNVSNRFAISKELNDLLAIVEMLVQEHSALDTWIIEDEARKEAKKQRVRQYMEYAKERGALN